MMNGATFAALIAGVLIFPGFLFTGVWGLLASWIDRKVTARVQWRVGPPLLQPLYDFVKLLGKETIVPHGALTWVFLLAPVVGVAAVSAIAFMLWLPVLGWEVYAPLKFSGDVILVVYLLAIPSLCVIIGGMAARNPLSALGSSREMKLVLAYELPFVLALIVPIIQSGGSVRIDAIYAYQVAHGAAVLRLSGILALLAAIPCMQAKLTLVPFDIPEAETEIMAGPYTEYSGPPLALFKLMRAMLLVVVPLTLIMFLCGGLRFVGVWSSVASILKYVALLVVITLIRNTNPRLRIDQAVRFFWTWPLLLAVAAIVAAAFGI
jgi:NADH-quinone oxidoreductase subunit H